MKRQTQAIGVRDWYGWDFLSLQEEPLKVIDSFFSQWGPFILSGCEVTNREDGKHDISPGLVALEGPDGEGNLVKVVAPFAGVTAVDFPIYLVLNRELQTDVYKDGKVKPTVVIYSAIASTVMPTKGSSLIFAGSRRGMRFLDAITDPLHRFITDAERTKWNNMAPNRLATTTANGLMSAADKKRLDRMSPCCVVAMDNPITKTNLTFDDLLYFDNTAGIWKTRMVDVSANGVSITSQRTDTTNIPMELSVVIRRLSTSSPFTLGTSFTMMSKNVTIPTSHSLIYLRYMWGGNFYFCVNYHSF